MWVLSRDMQQITFRAISIIWTFFATITLAAQENVYSAQSIKSEIRNFRIYYPVNKTALYPNYMSNAQNIDTIRRYLAESPRIDSIVIYSYASPEGPYRFNSRLAKGRGKTAKRFIMSLMPADRQLPDSIIHLRPEAENWQGLREEIVTNYHLGDRDRVLEILDSDIANEEKKTRLKRLSGGKAWRHIIKTIMPRLRYATWISVWQPILPELTPAEIKAEVPSKPVTDKPELCVEVPTMEQKTIFALKTNMLYDVASIVNVSVEVPIYENKFSVLYQHHFPWFNWGEGNNKYCIRFLSFGGEARWWFKPQPRAATGSSRLRDRLMGHYVGIYGMGGKYDFNWKRDICYQGEFWSAGLSYGYSMPLGKWLNLEFSVSAGYANIPYRHYTPSDDYEILVRDPNKHGTWNYFGLTKAEISLVMPIMLTKWKKGGGR